MPALTLPAFGVAMFLLAASPGPGVFATGARALSNDFAHAAILLKKSPPFPPKQIFFPNWIYSYILGRTTNST